MTNNPQRKPSEEDASKESKSSAEDQALTEQEIALLGTSSPAAATGHEPVPAGEDESTPEEKRIAQERELDEKLGTEKD